MRILITGSEGTLGKVLKTELRQRGHDVYGCDLQHCSDAKVLRADISVARQLSRLFEFAKPDVVYHMAAEFGRANGTEFFEQLWMSNCIGTRNVIEECAKANAHMIFASSSESYGDAADQGTLHEDDLIATVPKFWNEYALTKYTNEKQIEVAIHTIGLRATVLRYFNAWGEGERYTPYRSVVCLFVYRLLSGLPITVYKDYHRAFLYVGDWVKAVANASERLDKLARLPFNVFNIAGEEYCTVEEMKDKVLAAIGGSKSEISYLSKEAANIQNKRADTFRARRYLDFAPTTTLEQALPGYVAWMKREHGL